MRHSGKLRVLSLIAGFGAACALVMPTGSAYADTTTSLPITSFYQIVADTAHGHLFISEGSSSVNHILVTDLSGQQVTTITGQDGVMGLALSPDGSTLYAALSASHEVSAIDTSTLQQTATYPIGDANTPQDVAVQSGKVWLSYNDGSFAPSGVIGDIDLAANPPVFHARTGLGSFYSAPELAADPQDTGVLVAALPAMDPATVASFDVSADPPTVNASTLLQNCDNEQDLAVVPGGAEFILACGAPYAHYRYSTADLSQQGSYASTFYPSAVAIAANGDVAAGTSNGDSSKPDVYIYAPDGDTPLSTLNLVSSGSELMSRGLAWSADESQLFAVLRDSPGGSSYSLQVIDSPTLGRTNLSFTGPSTAFISKSVKLTGSLTLSGGTPLPAGTAISITRTVAGGTGTANFDTTTAADGSFSLTDTPPAVGQYTYTASYAGSTTQAPASASQAVTVTLIGSNLRLTGPSTAYLTKSVTLTGSLTLTDGTTPPAGTAISITRTGVTGPQDFNTTTAADGSFTLTDTPPALGSYTYTASYAGSATTAPATAAQPVTVTLAPASLTLSSGQSIVKYNSTIHITAHLGTTATNRTVSIYAQPFGSSQKKLLKTGTVDSSGNLTASYVAPHSTTFSAVFTGDAQDGAATATHVVYVQAKVTLTLRGNFGTRRVGNTTYLLYHRSGRLKFTVKVAPNKPGQCVKVQVQAFVNGRWRGATSGCASLSGTSSGSGAVKLTKSPLNVRFRLRFDYVRSPSDTSNLNADSAWGYFMVER